MTKQFKPYADDAASLAIGGLTFENGTDKVSVYGSHDFARDAAGLEAARKARAALDAIVASLEAGPLDGPAVAEAPTVVANPFA